MKEPIDISHEGILFSALAIILLSTILILQHINIYRTILISALRCLIQLTLIGYILHYIFEPTNRHFLFIIILIMFLVATYEIFSRQTFKLNQKFTQILYLSALIISAGITGFFTVIFIIDAKPWYSAQYLIPVVGMLLGNTMNSIAISSEHFLQIFQSERNIINQKLYLGQTSSEAIKSIKSRAIKTALIPSINSMAGAGLVTLPGMMTGQILSGTNPHIAVKYQVIIFFMIVAGNGFGTIFITNILGQKLFDKFQKPLYEQIKQK